MKRIAVWNTAFLGDAVLTLPLVQSLRAAFPEAELDFYVRGGLGALFRAHPAVTRVFSYDKRSREKGAGGFLRLAREVAGRNYSLWISAHTSPRSGALARLSGAAMRIGYAESPLARLWYTHTVPRRFQELEEIERLLQLLQPLGVAPASTWPELALPEEDTAAAAAFFGSLYGPVLGLHPGSVWGSKRWPARSFARVGALALEAGAHVLLFAGPGEEDMAAAVRDHIRESSGSAARERLRDLSGTLSLPRLAAFLGRLSCYLTNDSGPMHLAWAQRVPVTAIFGPTVHSLGFFPRGDTSTVFEIDLECRPCGLHGPQTCPLGHHRCMEAISPEDVWADVRAKLRP